MIDKAESFYRYLVRNKVFAGQNARAFVAKFDNGTIECLKITELHNDEAIAKIFDRWQTKGSIYYSTISEYDGPNYGDFELLVRETGVRTYDVIIIIEWGISSLQSIADIFDITIHFQADEVIKRIQENPDG